MQNTLVVMSILRRPRSEFSTIVHRVITPTLHGEGSHLPCASNDRRNLGRRAKSYSENQSFSSMASATCATGLWTSSFAMTHIPYLCLVHFRGKRLWKYSVAHPMRLWIRWHLFNQMGRFSLTRMQSSLFFLDWRPRGRGWVFCELRRFFYATVSIN